VIDDVTKECLAAVADTSIPGRRAARELEAVIARRDAPDLIVSDHGSGADHLSPRDLAAPAMAIGSNPLRSTRKSARAAVGSVFRELFEVLMGQRAYSIDRVSMNPPLTAGSPRASRATRARRN
jgi:hypothetical protein